MMGVWACLPFMFAHRITSVSSLPFGRFFAICLGSTTCLCQGTSEDKSSFCFGNSEQMPLQWWEGTAQYSKTTVKKVNPNRSWNRQAQSERAQLQLFESSTNSREAHFCCPEAVSVARSPVHTGRTTITVSAVFMSWKRGSTKSNPVISGKLVPKMTKLWTAIHSKQLFSTVRSWSEYLKCSSLLSKSILFDRRTEQPTWADVALSRGTVVYCSAQIVDKQRSVPRDRRWPVFKFSIIVAFWIWDVGHLVQPLRGCCELRNDRWQFRGPKNIWKLEVLCRSEISIWRAAGMARMPETKQRGKDADSADVQKLELSRSGGNAITNCSRHLDTVPGWCNWLIHSCFCWEIQRRTQGFLDYVLTGLNLSTL